MKKHWRKALVIVAVLVGIWGLLMWFGNSWSLGGGFGF